MERNAEETKINEAQLLARLRRRPASAPVPNDDALDFIAETKLDLNDESVEKSRESMKIERAEKSVGSEISEIRRDGASVETNEPRQADKKERRDADRTEALRRLVAGGAPKEPMSALSPTLRDLRDELNADAASYSAVFDADSVPSTDATLDLIESELASKSAPSRESEAQSDAARASNDGENESNDSSIPEEAALKKSEQSLNFRKLTGVSPRIDVVGTGAPDAEKTEKRVAVSDLMVVSHLKKGYVKAKKLIPVLQGVDLTARQGELFAIVGQSGSGKSTLLHLMGTLDVPDSGTIHFDGQRIDNLPSAQRDVLRNYFIGMIFQFYHLIPEMTTLENVLAPLMIRDSIFQYFRNRSKYIEKAKGILDLVGLSHRLRHRPNELSGGEMQRASIARALVAEPRILLADEPTGNLDSKASVGILKLLRKLNEEQNLTVVMVTHDMSQAAEADRALRLVDGLVVPE